MEFLKSKRSFFVLGLAACAIPALAYLALHPNTPDATRALKENNPLKAQLSAQQVSLPATIERVVCLPRKLTKQAVSKLTNSDAAQDVYGYACTVYISGAGQPVQWSTYPNENSEGYLPIFNASLAELGFDISKSHISGATVPSIDVKAEIKSPRLVSVTEAATAIKTLLGKIGAEPVANSQAALDAVKVSESNKAWDAKFRSNEASWSN